MAYTISSDTVGLAVGPISETANDVHEALSRARQMNEDGLANIVIADETGRKIDGDELLDCLTGKKRSLATFKRNRVKIFGRSGSKQHTSARE
jgi:hypothetical protein